MKLLLDEMMPEELCAQLVGHQVSHVGDHGWRKLSNGRLLAAAINAGFQVLITKDGNIPYQQNLTGLNISLVVLRPRTQTLEDLFALVPQILSAIERIGSGEVVKITPAG